MATFYGLMKDKSFHREMKERRIEDLILKFAAHADRILGKDKTLEGVQMKSGLHDATFLFAKLLSGCLHDMGHVSPELNQRLESYIAKLTPLQQSGTAYSDSGYDSSSTNRDRDSVVPPNRMSRNTADMSLVLTVAGLFKIPNHNLQTEVDNINKFCTEKVDGACSRVWFVLTDGSSDRQP
jgi:hypothetical protein